jgi:centromere-localized protein 2
MPPKEATLLSDFLLAPAELRHILTLEQFTEIFPNSLRASPAIKSLYQELQRLRHEDVELVRENIVEEIKKSRPLRRQCARERRQDDHAAVAGLDLVALEMEEEVLLCAFL